MSLLRIGLLKEGLTLGEGEGRVAVNCCDGGGLEINTGFDILGWVCESEAEGNDVVDDGYIFVLYFDWCYIIGEWADLYVVFDGYGNKYDCFVGVFNKFVGILCL